VGFTVPGVRKQFDVNEQKDRRRDRFHAIVVRDIVSCTFLPGISKSEYVLIYSLLEGNNSEVYRGH
jgi:hypothetical protein